MSRVCWENSTRQFGRAVKAVVLGTIPKGHGFESHSCHVFQIFFDLGAGGGYFFGFVSFRWKFDNEKWELWIG
jgi:hypothetical protein